MEDVSMDGAKAVGKTAVFRVRRGQATDESFDAYPCATGGGAGSSLRIAYEEKDVDLVRNMTRDYKDTCPRVHIKITGRDPYVNSIFKAKVIAILDTEPAEKKKLPEGVDFISIDDVAIAGDKANGKVAQIEMYRSTTTDKKFTAFSCEHIIGSYMSVTYSEDQKDAVKSIGTTSIGGCKTLKIKLNGHEYYSKTSLKATLIAVQ